MGNEEYITRDFWISGALLASGKKMVRVKWEGSIAFFVFGKKAECEKVEAGYYDGTLKFPAKKFSESLRDLKHRMYDSKNRY